MRDPSVTTQAGESTRWRYGLFAVLGAVTAILAAFVFASLRYNTASDVSTALAAITGTVGTILGGYLGVQTGSQGKEESEAARQKAEARAVALAAAAPYEHALEALAMVEGRPVRGGRY
jgi:threonine/homoserine/homoserine lactone efflux protein